MAQDYIEISTTGDISGAKKYNVLRSSNLPDGFTTPVENSATLNGDTVQSFGVGKQEWDFDLLVNYSGAATGFGIISDIKSVFTLTTATVLKFRDQTSTTYDAVLLNKGEYKPKPLSVRWYDADSKWVVTVKLRQA